MVFGTRKHELFEIPGIVAIPNRPRAELPLVLQQVQNSLTPEQRIDFDQSLKEAQRHHGFFHYTELPADEVRALTARRVTLQDGVELRLLLPNFTIKFTDEAQAEQTFAKLPSSLKTRHMKFGGALYEVHSTSPEVDVVKLIRELVNRPNVVFAEPGFIDPALVNTERDGLQDF